MTDDLLEALGPELAPPKPNRSNKWFRRKRKQLIAERGGVCEKCGSMNEMEFAHVKPTSLNGRGRGFNHRVLDVMRHPDAYRLLCNTCHNELDLGLKKKRAR